MEPAKKDKYLGIISLAMIPITIVGIFAFSLIFLSAPAGIICGIISARRGNRLLGITGALLNGLLLIAYISLIVYDIS